MQVKSITVPTDSHVILVTVELGAPGAIGEFRWNPDQAMQFASDLYGAAQSARGGIIVPRNAAGGRHYGLEAETAKFSAFGNFTGE